ncbi:MAG TPA: alpha-2-macroglobulin family protein, partial [Cyclobacteriaceae bacterium]
VMANPVVGKVTVEKAGVYVETGALYKPLQSDDHKWDLKKAYEICEEAKKRFPNSDGAIMCENLQEDIRTKSISATIEENNLPNEPFRGQVSYRNFTDLNYRIIKVTRDEVRALRRKLEKDYYSDREEKFIEYWLPKVPVKKGSFKLPDDGDYQLHNIEVKLDALPEGEYMVLYSNRADFAINNNALAYAFTVISNISYVHRNVTDGATEFFILNRKTGEPLVGVKADVFANKYNSSKGYYEGVKAGTFTSDAAGYFKILLMKKENSRNFYVNFSKGADVNSTESIDRQNYYYGNGTLNQYKYEEPQSHVQTFFFLDRAIYRPGQTIYFKGLVVNTDGKNPKIMPGYSTTIRLLDVNYQEQGQVNVKSNEYGTFSGTFTAPSTGLTGEMQLQNTDGSGNISFSVEEYKRPKFEVGFDPVKGSFRLNESIKVEGFARAYSGANIDGAQVKYRVVRVANFPFWWWCRWGYYPSSPEMEITSGETTSDVNGKFGVDFSAIPDLTVDQSSDPTFTYTVYADVTDINGETHSSSTSVSVGYKSLLVSVPMNNINKDGKQKNEFAIQTTNLAGEFQAASGQIKIYLLKTPTKAFRNRMWAQADRKLYAKEEYYKLFPHDLFEDETNKFKWAKDKEVFTLNFNTSEAKTFSLNDLAQWHTGEYVLEISAKDKDGKDVKEVSYFTVFAPSSKEIPTPAFHYFQGVKLVAEPGEKASFSTGTSEKITVLYEVERDGQILSKEWLTLKNEQRLFEIPVKEEYRGNIGVHYTFIKENRLYSQSFVVTVPYTNKELDITFESFRDKLQPGAQEQWKILIKGKTADKIAAEMVATLYDASLDEFRVNNWYASFYNSLYTRLGWASTNGFDKADLNAYVETWNPGHSRSPSSPYFDSFNWFGYNFYQFSRDSRRYRAGAAPMMMKSMVADEVLAEPEESKTVRSPRYREELAEEDSSAVAKPEADEGKKVDLSDVKIRKNFNETAFFYPHLQTNEKGEIIINFTIPEALTRWKMLGFAHTADLKSGMTGNQLVTQKDIMVVPNQPRFFRENDKMKFSAKISSLVDKDLTGQAQLQFFDAFTMKPVDDVMKNNNTAQNFSLKPRQSTSLEWSIEIPEGIQAITYRIVAKAGNFSDGEEMVLPVVTNRMLITETLPLPIRGKQTKEFKLDKLLNNKSTTLRHQRYTLEFTSNPAWYAIQALPYLMEYPYECVEQTFSRYYANSVASHIANSNPKIKNVFDTWKNIQPDALLSNLEKNQDLKTALLEETPWVLQAKDESQRKRALGLLFDLNRMGNEMERALDKVLKAQESSGGFSWFPGFPEDRYMTQHIVGAMGHLDVMDVKSIRNDHRTWNMINSAVDYMDNKLTYDYEQLKEAAKRKEIKLEDDNINYIHFNYLYARSYFKDVEISGAHKEAFNYFLGQAKKYWLSYNIYLQGMTCLALNRYGD